LTWEDRFSELADHRTIHGHCKSPKATTKNNKLGMWVKTKGVITGCPERYRLYNRFSNPKLESLPSNGQRLFAWEDRLSELADFAKSTAMFLNTTMEMQSWVSQSKGPIQFVPSKEKIAYDHPEFRNGKFGFEWDRLGAAEDRLSELADFQ
jgi:hypothetical protein